MGDANLNHLVTGGRLVGLSKAESLLFSFHTLFFVGKSLSSAHTQERRVGEIELLEGRGGVSTHIIWNYSARKVCSFCPSYLSIPSFICISMDSCIFF